MRVLTVAAILALAACADAPDSDTAAPADARPAVEAGAPVGPDTLRISAEADTLARRPAAPVRVDGACPFEGCAYGTWTTTAETTVYASPSAAAESFTVPAETVLNADTGFVLLTALGVAVAERDTEMYLSFEDTIPLAAGDTLLVMEPEGEGSSRAWSGGRVGFTGVDRFAAPPGETPPLRQVSESEYEWWAHVTMDDGREGWLWMDETPTVEGADALGM